MTRDKNNCKSLNLKRGAKLKFMTLSTNRTIVLEKMRINDCEYSTRLQIVET